MCFQSFLRDKLELMSLHIFLKNTRFHFAVKSSLKVSKMLRYGNNTMRQELGTKALINNLWPEMQISSLWRKTNSSTR